MHSDLAPRQQQLPRLPGDLFPSANPSISRARRHGRRQSNEAPGPGCHDTSGANGKRCPGPGARTTYGATRKHDHGPGTRKTRGTTSHCGPSPRFHVWRGTEGNEDSGRGVRTDVRDRLHNANFACQRGSVHDDVCPGI